MSSSSILIVSPALLRTVGSKLDDYLIVAISSEGTVRNSAGDTIKMELLDVLRGEYEAHHVSVWYYRLDNIDEVSYETVLPIFGCAFSHIFGSETSSILSSL